jgi:hypothetical protein
MRTLARLVLVVIWFPAIAAASEPAATAEEVLLDRPGGRPVAILLAGAPRKLGEERDGFVRVTLEGWVRVPGGADPGSGVVPTPGSEPAAPAPAPPSPVPRAPRLSGILRTGFASRILAGAASVRLLLLGPSADLDPRYAQLRAEHDAERAKLDTEIEALQREKETALNSQDNFREASKGKDRAAAAIAAREKQRRSLAEKYTAGLEELFERYRVAETTADASGAFAFPEAPAGSYRLLAVARRGEEVRRWYVPVTLPAEGGTRIELGPETVGDEPYIEQP